MSGTPTPTPRTDAAEASYCEWKNGIRTFQRDEGKKAKAVTTPALDGWDHARELETELAQLRADVRSLVDAFISTQRLIDPQPFMETIWDAFMPFIDDHPEITKSKS